MKKKLYFILITLSFFAFKMKAQSIDTLKLSKPLLPNPLAEVHNSTTLFEKLLVLSPFVLTIFVLFILVKMLRRMDFDIKEALKEFPTDDLIKKLGITTLTKDNLKDLEKFSSSRLIALMTSLSVISIAICLVCFYFYCYLKLGIPPDLSKLSTVLLSLGLGIVPYSMNKISEGLK